MFILSKDKNTLVNCNNIANMSMQKRTIYPSTDCWRIIVMYPAVEEDILYDTLDEFRTEKECRDVFNKLCCRIVGGNENEIIDMNDL